MEFRNLLYFSDLVIYKITKITKQRILPEIKAEIAMFEVKILYRYVFPKGICPGFPSQPTICMELQIMNGSSLGQHSVSRRGLLVFD